MSHVLHTTEPSLKLSSSYIANNYINNTYFIFSLATWGKYKGNTPNINLLLSFKIEGDFQQSFEQLFDTRLS